MKQYLLVILYILGPFITKSQPIQFQLNDNRPLSLLKASPDLQLQDNDNYLIHFKFFPNKETSLTFLNSNKAVFAIPNGTGAVYQLSNSQPNLFERIDSTLYHGYNYHAVNLIYKDTIFSLGGYGLWHVNGQLRYFNANKAEWELKPMDRLLPITTGNLTDFRSNKGNLYTYLINDEIEGQNNTREKNIDSIYKLSITNGSVTSIGKASEYIKQLPNMPIKFYSNYGAILLNSHEVILLDFENNKILNWQELKIADIFLSGLGKIKTTLQKDSVIYFYTENKLDSLVIPIHKMKIVGPIYVKDDFYWANSLVNNVYLFSILIVLIIALILYLIYRHKLTKELDKLKKIENKKITDYLKERNEVEGFSNLELEILQLLFSNMNQSDKVNVEMINTILGVTKKSTEVQRKQRSQIIASINIKAKGILQIEDDIIVRTKSEIDSRIVTYSLEIKHLDQLKEIIETKI
jgi:hypothetical protein